MDALSALSPATPSPIPGKRPGGLTPEQQAQVDKLQARDREVRAHEQAHLAAAGGLARGGATFSTTRGPDGKLYATGGEVSIDTSPVPNNPAATLAKARQIQAAASAPADPSGQDRSVAAAAARMAAQASQDLARKGQAAATGGALDLAG
jgi:hypothetical protein